jgi:ribosomal protein S27AE
MRVMRDTGHGREHRKDLLRLGLPFLAVLGLALLVRQEWAYMLAFVAGIPLALYGMYRQMLRSVRLDCPQCKAAIGRHGDTREGPVRFYCPKCDVVWDTGYEESRD